ncbi:hypothetical protein [Eubacterium ramulus]
MAIKGSAQVSVIDVTDAYSIMLTSEAYTFIGNTAGAPIGSSCSTEVVAFCGGAPCKKISITAADIKCPSGITASVTNNNTLSPTVKFMTTAVIASACEATIPIEVDGITINKKFSFAVAKAGSNGTNGKDGATGANGKGIKSTSITYQTGSSATSAPSGTWLSSPPQADPSNPYLWTRTIVTYTDDTTSTSYSVGSSIDGIEVGGRNLLLSTQTFQLPFQTRGTATALVKDADGFYYTSLRNAFTNYIYQFADLEINQEYTLSLYAKCDSIVYLEVKDDSANNIPLTYIRLDSKDWKLYTSTFIVEKNTAKPKIAFLTRQDTATVYIKKIKLEKGNVATDWTPAPEDQVNKGDVVNQTNAELELDGAILRLKGEHVTVDTKNFTLDDKGNATFSGDISGATGTFAGNVAAKSVTIESTDTTDAGKSAYMSVSSNGFNLITNSVTGSGEGNTYFTQNIVEADGNGVNIEVNDKTIVDGRVVTNAKNTASITTEKTDISNDSINLNSTSKVNVTAPKGFYVNGVKQCLYNWANADTYDAKSTSVPVISGTDIHYRDIPTDEFTLTHSGNWYKYGKRTMLKLNGDYVGNYTSCPYPPKGNSVFQWVMLLNVSEGSWWPGFVEITTGGQVSFRTVTSLGVTSLFDCTGTGFRAYGYIDFFNA